MQISAGLCWLVAALILGGIDMVAGTFYLLMIGLGCLAGAVVYWADLSLAWQCAAASVCAVAGCLMVLGFKAKHPEKDDAVSHPDARSYRHRHKGFCRRHGRSHVPGCVLARKNSGRQPAHRGLCAHRACGRCRTCC